MGYQPNSKNRYSSPAAAVVFAVGAALHVNVGVIVDAFCPPRPLLSRSPTRSFTLPNFQFFPIPRTPTTTTTHLAARRRSSNNNDDGSVGQGPNWIERSSPLIGAAAEAVNDSGGSSIDDYDLGIHGPSLDTGILSAKMFDAIFQGSAMSNTDDPDVRRLFRICAMDFTAKEATRAALKQNGLEMVDSDSNDSDAAVWAGDVDSIRIVVDDTDGNSSTAVYSIDYYDSWEEAVDDGNWQPGQTFSFVVRQAPAKLAELPLDQLLQALDPDGSLRAQAKGSGMVLPDEEIASLTGMATENVRRTQEAPRETEIVYAGDDTPGYRVMALADLVANAANDDPTATSAAVSTATTMHVMDALVSHGCLIVDLTNGGTTWEHAHTMADLWQASQTFFDYVDTSSDFVIPGLATAAGVGSDHAKVGYASYEDTQFLEVRRDRASGELLPSETQQVIGDEGCEALVRAFDTVADVAKSVVRVVVAASTEEADALDGDKAWAAASKLAEELVDDGTVLTAKDIVHSEGPVSMSPHRLCRYAPKKDKTSDDISTTASREVFGAHTDSTFLTCIPAASVAGLDVLDEDADQWYRPELAARRHWRAVQASLGNDPDALTETTVGDRTIPWHARYVILLPGELLQLTSRDEVLAAVHRVVATETAPRLSAPILLRGRPGTTMDCERYLGGTDGFAVLDECDGMTIEDIHDAMQPASFQ